MCGLNLEHQLSTSIHVLWRTTTSSVRSWSCTCSSCFQLVLRGEGFPDYQSSGQHKDLSGQAKWSSYSTNIIFQGSLKPHVGAFGAFRGTPILHRSQVYSALPQFEICNAAFPGRQLWFRFLVLKILLCSQFVIEVSDIMAILTVYREAFHFG